MGELLLTHGRQIAAARLKMFRHREPFVRLACLGAAEPSRTLGPCLAQGLLIGEFLPLLTRCSLEG